MIKDICLIIVLCMAAGCSSNDNNIKPMVSTPLVIDYFGVLRGYLEPCGCGGQPNTGGIPRRITYMEKQREKWDNILFIYANNWFGQTTPNDKLRADILLKTLPEMGFDALGLYDKDFSFGFSRAESLVKNIPGYVNGNIRYATGALFTVSATKTFSFNNITTIEGDTINLNVGITGVCSLMHQDRFERFLGNEYSKINITDPTSELEKILPTLSETNDLLIVIYGGFPKQIVPLAEKFPEVNIWIGGETGQIHSLEPLKVGDSFIVENNDKGRHGAQLRLHFDRGKNIKYYTTQVVYVDEDYPPEPKLQSMLEVLH